MYQGNMLEQGVMDMMGQNISESEMGRVGDGLERKSDSSENGIQDICSGDDLDDIAEGSKRKRYHRHTQYQIQEMESFFKECPHPDDKQRRELGRQLGLGPLQVKFWFQNKRTQVKTQNERFENAQLRADNERLKADNMRYKKALQTSACPHCNGPTIIGEVSTDEQHFRAENARLREEIDRISGIAAKYVGRPVQSQSYPLVPGAAPLPTTGSGSFPGVPPIGVAGAEMYMAGAASGGYLQGMGSGATEGDRSLVIELAVLAMEEVMRMAKLGEPLWVPNMDATSLVLNEEEYLRTFPQVIGPRPAGFKFEASRESGLIMMNPHRLVEVLMDVAQWTTMFSGIVTKAATLELLSTGMAGSYNGAVQVMTAEYQVPSPLVPTRECHFVRYCKQHGEGTWAVVDVSIDSLRPSLGVKCRRRPSGCVIQQMHSGYSKVTWIEHVEVNDRDIDNLYKPLVNSLLAFGAKRWVASLDRQCERLQCSLATTIHANNGVVCNQEGRRNMMKLAERMVISFCAGVSSSTTHTWTNLSGSGGDDVKIMTRKSMDDPGRPTGIVLCAATSFWIPYLPRRVFDFLRDENSRNEVSWDILSNGGIVEEITHIANGRDVGNCISLMRVDSTHSNQNTMLILQENSTDPTGSYIIYAPVEVIAMNMVLNGGGNPDYVAILPSGFSILPDGPPTGGAIRHTESPSGSLVTVAFQILVDSLPTAKVALGSVATISSLVTYTVDRIKSAMASQFA